MTRTFFFFLFFISVFFGLEAQTEISVQASWAAKEEVKVLSYTDFFTFQEQVHVTGALDEEGKATVSLNHKEVKQLMIEVEGVRALIYAEPNQTYQLEIPSYQGEQLNVLSKEKFVTPNIQKEGRFQINQKIRDFNKRMDNFMQEHAAEFVHKRMKPILKDALAKHQARMQSEPSAFVKVYTEYVYADLFLTGNYSRSEMQSQFIENRPLQLNNPEYVKFFRDFYSDYLRFFLTKSYETRINAAVNVHQEIDSLWVIFSENKYLKKLSEQQLLLVLVNELYHQANNPRFKKPAIVTLIKQVSLRTAFPSIKHITSHMLAKLDGLGVGVKAPDLVFIDENGNERKLSDYRGKYVYLDFWATWCTPCLNEMKLMNKLYPKFNSQIEFISLSMDRNERRMIKFLEKNPYEWVFGFVGETGPFKENYQVVALPRYFLIDPQGYLVQAPGKSPTQGIDQNFYQILQDFNPQKKQPGIWEMKQNPKRD